MLTYKNFQRLRLFQPNMSLLSHVLGVLVCLCAHVLWCAYVVTCLHTRMLGMPTCLEYLRAFVFGVFTCLYVYVCLLVLCPYVLTCNSIMLQTNSSPLEKALSKNFSHPSNECFIRRENPKNRVAMFSRYR